MSTDNDDPVNLLADAIDVLRKTTADELARVDGSIRGIHEGIAGMDRDIKTQFEGLTELVHGLASDVRTALSVVPSLTKRIAHLEEMLEHVPEGQSNGTGNVT